MQRPEWLTFSLYRSGSASNNGIAIQQGLITLQWHLHKISAMKIFADRKSARDHRADLEHFNKGSRAQANSGNKTGALLAYRIDAQEQEHYVKPSRERKKKRLHLNQPWRDIIMCTLKDTLWNSGMPQASSISIRFKISAPVWYHTIMLLL